METYFGLDVLCFTFFAMEFMAWFSHKYIMHGFLWVLHKDHHKKDHTSWFERNDLFFIFYAVISTSCVILWGEYNFWAGLPIGIGIFIYGVTYFLVHDIFIHQRFKCLEMPTIVMQKPLEGHTKCITNIWEKTMESVLECYGFL